MWSWLPWERARLERLRAEPLPEAWWRILRRNVPHLETLDDAGRRKLEGLVQLFLDDIVFEGCGGLELTDEHRVTIAAQACVLLLGLDVDKPYPHLDVVRVYPSGYIDPTPGNLPSRRAGESSSRGFVVLSWRDSRKGGRDPDDGNNVVFHEFAHQLDTEDGVADGAPILRSADRYGPWAKVLSRAFAELQDDVDHGRRGVIDGYGATNPAEFFAVATEHFFEQPRRLKTRWPDVYEQLADYYGQDPAGRP